MADTLQELTLQLSRDLSALEAERRRRLAALEEERLAALHALPAAANALQQFEAARESAIAAHKKDVAKAAAEFQNAVAKARNERSNDDIAIQQQYINADRAEDDKKGVKLQTEEKRYQQELADIAKDVPVDKQVWARDAAYQKHKSLIADIQDVWKAALRSNRDKQQLDRQTLLEKERVALDNADTAQNAAVVLADAAQDSSIEAAQSTLSATLRGVPAAKVIDSDFDKRSAALLKECAAREDELFAKFKEARKKITG